MKKEWEKRLSAIEAEYQHLYKKERFQEWLRDCPDCQGDYWQLTKIVPQEFKMECVFYILDKLKPKTDSALTN